MGKSQRQKGHDWERDVAGFLRHRFLPGDGWTVRRSQQADQAYEPDVVVTTNIPPLGDCPNPVDLWIECISSNRPPIWDKLAQAIGDAEKHGNGRLPAVFAKRTQRCGSKGYEVVVMRLSDFSRFVGWE